MNGVKRARLTREAKLEAARRLARVLAERGALRVILFGSLCDPARAGVDSDIDLVVVMPGVEHERFHRRLGDLDELYDAPCAVDLLVYSPREWEEIQHRWFFREEVLKKGMVLFERAG